MASKQDKPRYVIVLRWILRSVTIACLGFWLYFNVASFFYWRGEEGMSGAMIHLVMTGIIIALLLLTFLFELLAGLVFIFLGIATYAQWGQHNLFVAVLMCLVLVVTGMMFLYLTWLDFQARRSRAGGKAANS